MPETPETACCDIHSPVVCEPDTVVTVPCYPNCPSWPTPETAQVPADLLDEFERELERVDDGRIPYEPTREDFAAALAAVLPVVRAAERAMVAEEIEADFRENVNDAGINIDADRIISARAWGMYRAARIARGRRP